MMLTERQRFWDGSTIVICKLLFKNLGFLIIFWRGVALLVQSNRLRGQGLGNPHMSLLRQIWPIRGPSHLVACTLGLGLKSHVLHFIRQSDKFKGRDFQFYILFKNII